MQDLEQERARLRERVEALELETRNSAEDAIEDLQDLIRRLERQGPDLLKLRLRLKARIKHVVSSILIASIEERSEQDRTITFVIHFNHWSRVRFVQVRIKRSPQNRGNILETVNTHFLELDQDAVAKAEREGNLLKIAATVHDLSAVAG